MERIKEFVYNVFGQFMLPRRDLLISWAVVSRACKAGAKHPAQLAAAVGDNIEMNGADCRSGHRAFAAKLNVQQFAQETPNASRQKVIARRPF
ncbi:hypothetical protein [Mesorhizobium sp. LSJC264A00]|uniref:hypothetical protein n=1 Tax=unclassified Mesorhizobium TaxID=325217 RepID=UPI0003CE9D2C|nr:hypothetical protein [Mesorhizobium sp. LSJC264A00]ESX10656.1 hypothetical protein X767_32195 [Mesorhizobium sp. LSJC264A00]